MTTEIVVKKKSVRENAKRMCDECGESPAVFGLFKLSTDGTKTWRHVCRNCDDAVAMSNKFIKSQLPAGTLFKEVK